MSQSQESLQTGEKDIIALTETFRKLGWNPDIPRVISSWGEFICGENGFELGINEGDKPFIRFNKVLTYSDKVDTFFELYFEQESGHLELKGRPVFKMSLMSMPLEKEDNQELLITLFPERSFVVVVNRNGKVRTFPS